VPLALTGYEIALGIVALAFVVFALVAALVIPRSRPSFPGNRLGLFIAICSIFFVAQMGAVLALAEVGEADEPVHEETAGGETTETEISETETTGTTETETETETETTAAEGDPTAGKEVFLGSAACGSCHTLADAGTTAEQGPNLDTVLPGQDAEAVHRSIVDPGAEISEGYEAGMPENFGEILGEEELDVLVTYLLEVAGG
jgi:mono/diheme cytochrome c family protein